MLKLLCFFYAQNKSATAFRSRWRFLKQRKVISGFSPAKLCIPHPANSAGCNIRYLSCVEYTIPHLLSFCKFCRIFFSFQLRLLFLSSNFSVIFGFSTSFSSSGILFQSGLVLPSRKCFLQRAI